jgi:hypothetical protein
MKKNFTYEEYVEILNMYSGRFKSFEEAKNESKFVILRHDVEFSVARALKMAEIEHSNGVSSTFFFQVLSNAYNPFSKINHDAIQLIHKMGHSVGLHAYISHLNDGETSALVGELKKQKEIFEKGLEMDCLLFSFHRPPMWALKIREDEICSMLNAYGPSFFELNIQSEDIKYVADSKHNWFYGHPLDVGERRKIQILMHPDEWTENGDQNLVEFFNELKNEHNQEFLRTLRKETKHYEEACGVN